VSTPVRADHVFPCTPDQYWAMFFDPEHVAQVQAALDLVEHREVWREETPDRLRQRLRIAPRRDVPAPVRRAVPGLSTAYEEERVFDKAGREIAWRVFPDFRPEAITCSGSYRVLPVAGGCRRVLDGRVEVRIFGIGGIVERAIAQDVERSYAIAAEVARTWIAERGIRP